MNLKKILIIISIIVVTIFVVSLVVSKDTADTTIENGIATNDVEIEKVTFSQITKKHENGITTLSAKMTNNSSKNKSFTVNITLKDENGKTVQSLTQVVENLEEGKSKVLSTGILGDYSNINDIKFEVVDK